jgi:murein DD-endopeptidase MepM/ murein hydrolase activator NlpD
VRLSRGTRRFRVRALRHAALVVLAIAALVSPAIAGPLGAPAASAATAAPTITYPSWADVQAARANEANTKAQIAAIEALLAQLEADLAAAQADEIAKGEAYETAQNAYDDQVIVTDDLTAQADAARTQADTSKAQAARLLALLAKSGNGDVMAELLGGDATTSSDLLYRLGAMDRLTDQSDAIYVEAIQKQNTAQALTDQAQIAEDKRAELQKLAEEALAAAQAATVAADKAVQEQQEHQAELNAQLAVLTERRQATEADYQAGVVAREKARLAALAAAAAAAAQAGQVNAFGWARPSAGYISSGYGNRFHPIYHRWQLHNGTDIAGQGCGAPIHAAHSGTVTYSGPNGTLGNYVQIDHGDGTSSGYGHIVNGGILVGHGQHVNAGQVIAYVGRTGAATGCHLHFMIRVNGQLTDPVPFMSARGIRLG